MWKAGGGSWTAASDARLKSVVGKFTSSLDELAAIEVVRYKYLPGNPLDLDTETEFQGFVAQDLQKVLPAAVTEGKDGYLGVNLDHVYLAGINAIKELSVQGKAKDAKILALERELAKVKTANAAIETRMAAIEQALARNSNPVK